MILLTQGRTRTVVVDGVAEKVTPYVGTSVTYPGQLGIGIHVAGSDEVWYQSPGPYPSLVRLLATLLVLNNLPAYSDRVLAEAMLFVTEARKKGSVPELRRTILELLDGRMWKYQELLDKVQAFQPGFEVFQWMLAELLGADIPINSDELYDLVEQRMLVMSPLIDLHDQLRVAHQHGHSSYQAFIDEPIKYSEQSLADYLAAMGVRTLVTYLPAEGGNTTEHRFDVSQVDKYVKQWSTGRRGVPLQLWQVSGVFGTRLRERIVPVTVRYADGALYTLGQAVYRNDEIVVTTTSRIPGRDPETKDYTVLALRLWVTPVPRFWPKMLRIARKQV